MITVPLLRGGGPGGTGQSVKIQSSSGVPPFGKTPMFSDGAQCKVSHLFSPASPLIKSQLSHPEITEAIPTVRRMFTTRHDWRSHKESE